jgi:PAS domain S-box-containing protein
MTVRKNPTREEGRRRPGSAAAKTPPSGSLHRAEEALRESEERFRTLFETMVEGVVYQEADGRISLVNPSAERILGLKPDQLQGRTSVDPRWQAVREDGSDFPGDQHPAMVALRTGREVRNTVMGVSRPGRSERVWILVHAVPRFRSGESAPYCVYTTFTDITERKRAEDRLAASEKRFRQLSDLLPQAVFETDLHGNLIFANQRGFQMAGYSPAAIADGIDVYALIAPEDHERVRENMQKVLAGAELPEHEYRAIRRDGTTFPVLLKSAAILDQGRPVGLRGTFFDITARKRAEAELGKSREALRNLAAHLEAVREEERVVLSRELHDNLGQLLTALKLDHAWLEKHLVRDDHAALLQKLKDMRTTTDEAVGCVRRLAAELRPAILGPGGMWAAIEAEAARCTALTAVPCTVELRNCPTCRADVRPGIAAPVVRIVQEALTNVARHAGATAASIACGPEGDHCHVRIADDGRGMRPEVIADPRSIGIVGMRERALSFGGELVIDAAPGRGTTVTVRIPLRARTEEGA